MVQIGVDICNLPEVQGFKHIVVAIDYFSKWSEAKPLKNKQAESIANFLYELICRHGCFATQINDQGREFVNSISDHLHEMTGAYPPPPHRVMDWLNGRTVLLKIR